MNDKTLGEYKRHEKHDADDFEHAHFAMHPVTGSVATKGRMDWKWVLPGWYNTGDVSRLSDQQMADAGWSPVRECPDPEQHDDAGNDPCQRHTEEIERLRGWIDRAEKAEKERDEARAAMSELAPAEVCVRGDWFKPSELPEVLGRVMDARDEARREAKRYYLLATKSRPLTPDAEEPTDTEPTDAESIARKNFGDEAVDRLAAHFGITQEPTDAEKAVRELHRPAQVYTLAEDCTEPESHEWSTASHGGDELCLNEPTGQQFCTECCPEDAFDCTDYPYPCPTIQALDSARVARRDEETP